MCRYIVPFHFRRVLVRPFARSLVKCVITVALLLFVFLVIRGYSFLLRQSIGTDSTDVAFFNEESHEIAKAAEDSTKSASLARSALRDSSEVVFSTVQSDGKTEGQRRESSQEKDEGGLVVTDDEADDEEGMRFW